MPVQRHGGITGIMDMAVAVMAIMDITDMAAVMAIMDITDMATVTTMGMEDMAMAIVVTEATDN